MNRIFLALILPAFTACFVNDSIAEGPGSTSAEARVSDALPGFCESECARIIACQPDEDCVCDEGSDYCECTSVPDQGECAVDCEEYLTEEFTGHGDACAEVGERFMNCISAASCDELTSGDVCELSDAEAAPCEGDDAPPAVPDPTRPVPGPGPVTCGAGSSGGSAPGSDVPFACESEVADCSDGNTYGIACTEAPSGPPLCTCLLNGAGTKSFRLAEAVCPSQADVNAGCGFWLVDGATVGTDPDPTSPVSCTGPSGGSGTETSCSQIFADCGGRDYTLDCVAGSGGELCTCSIDGVEHASFRYPGSLCALSGTGTEVDVANAGCGWYLF